MRIENLGFQHVLFRTAFGLYVFFFLQHAHVILGPCACTVLCAFALHCPKETPRVHCHPPPAFQQLQWLHSLPPPVHHRQHTKLQVYSQV